MKEIVIYGRGGEGAKTAAFMLAKAAILDNLYAQAFPEYGPERTGAPVKAFVRIDDKPILTHSPISNPDILIVINRSLLEDIETIQNLKKNGLLIINSNKAIDQAISNNIKQFFVDANDIAMKFLGKPITNIITLGAFFKASSLISITSFEKVIEEELHDLDKEMIDKNINAFRFAYMEAKNA